MAKKPKTFVDAIDAAFSVITVKKGAEQPSAEVTAAAKETFSKAVSGYMTGLDTKGNFNKACREAARFGANKDSIALVQKFTENTYGGYLWAAYGDMVVYGTTDQVAAELATVDLRDLQLLVKNNPVNAENKKLFKDLPKWLVKERTAV